MIGGNECTNVEKVRNSMFADRKLVQRIILRNIESLSERFGERRLTMTNTEAYVALRPKRAISNSGDDGQVG